VERRVMKKKSRQLSMSFGQLNALEEYVLSLDETSAELEQLGSFGFHDDMPTAFPNTIMDLMKYNKQTMVVSYMNDINLSGAAVPPKEVMHGGMVYPNIMAPKASYSPPKMGMYTNPTYFTATYNEPQLTDNLLCHKPIQLSIAVRHEFPRFLGK
jgi:hypothetical protein